MGAADLLAAVYCRGDGNAGVAGDETDAVFEVLGGGDAGGLAHGLGFDVVVEQSTSLPLGTQPS